MRLAIPLPILLLVACSDGSGFRSSAETTVQVLDGGTDCLIVERPVPCTKVVRHLTDELHIERSERLIVLVVGQDRPAAARQAVVAYELQGAGFTHVEMKVVQPTAGAQSAARNPS